MRHLHKLASHGHEWIALAGPLLAERQFLIVLVTSAAFVVCVIRYAETKEQGK